MAIYLGENQISLAGTPQTGWMPNSRLLTTKTYSFTLSETNFSSLTPSTSNQTLTLPATTYTTTPSSTITCIKIGESFDGTVIDVTQHDYIVVGTVVSDYVYNTSMSSTIHPIRFATSRDQQGARYLGVVNSTTGILLDNQYSTTSTYLTQGRYTLYQKADNTYAFYTGAYGFWGYASAGLNPTNIELKCQSFTMCANDSWAPATVLSAINASSMTFNITWYVYEGNNNMYSHLMSSVTALAANS